MFDDFTICPYPGLRSFNEDESIFFKGREEQVDEVTRLLQANKFLMVTGASGDGKSSLIFAGLVPNARAGFFKSKYSNWQVAHFRPERNPVSNFAKALDPLLSNVPAQTIETELNRGFSSLVDLYKNSELYLDETSTDYQQGTEQERDDLKRQNANLLVIVDQFEEFFTNTENYFRGVPSQESQTLVNLLLETARIALREDLPIYVVFTMRSDYIGQCAAFRGLPEYIGFSQFFVPRLKRKDLQQVIEEPLELNGNAISRRLVERLLFDLYDGEDQLPILQHALSRVWHQASNGNEELDLVHYAMVGGMPSSELPEDQLKQFDAWFDQLDDWDMELLENPGLKRVLDIHADQLYQTTWMSLDSAIASKLSIGDTKRIIALTFACLTKIDDSRAVRNLMRLEEITRIINLPGVDARIVDQVIRAYREQGNTFIRPFVDEQHPETDKLEDDVVLDITHESLIRNWVRLKKWVDKEFEYYETFVDFQKQMDRWSTNGRGRGYLLPIGPLTYFEKWYNECKPNEAWIQRYLDIEEHAKAKSILDNAREFLRRSKRRVAVSRAFVKYGTTRLASVLSIVFVFLLSGFYYLDSERKLNDTVLHKIEEDAQTFLDDPAVPNFMKGVYLVALERSKKGALISSLETIDSAEMRLQAADNVYTFLFDLDNTFNAPVKKDLISFTSKTLETSDLKLEDKMNRRTSFLFNLINDNYNNPGSVQSVIDNQLSVLLTELEEVRNGEVEQPLFFNHAYYHVINNSADDPEVVRQLLDDINPFDDSSKSRFDRLYPESAYIINGRVGGLSHNGGYQLVGSMFAAMGDLDKALQCVDSVLKYNSNYTEGETFNNHFNLAAYFIQYGHPQHVKPFITQLSSKTGISRPDLMKEFLDRTGFMKFIFSYYWWEIPAYNYGIAFLDLPKINWLFDLSEQMVRESFSGDERNYELALLFKQRGIYEHRHRVDLDMNVNTEELHAWFDKAVDSYLKVSEPFLLQNKTIDYRYYLDGFRSMTRPRWYYFAYPDHLDDEWYNDRFISPAYGRYILEDPRFTQIYPTGDKLEVFNDWISNYYEVYMPNNGSNTRRNLPNLDRDILIGIYEKTGNPEYAKFDKTLLQLLLANAHFAYGNIEEGNRYADEVNLRMIQPLASRWEYLNYTFVQNQALELAKHMANAERFDRSKLFLETMYNNNDRAITYVEVAKELLRGKNKEEAFVFLDSAVSKGRKADHSLIPAQFSYQYYLINVFSGIGGSAMNSLAYEVSNRVPVSSRDAAVNFYVRGIAYEGNYFRAWQAIPTVGPKQQRLFAYSLIFIEDAYKKGSREGWENFDDEWLRMSRTYVPFDDNY